MCHPPYLLARQVAQTLLSPEGRIRTAALMLAVHRTISMYPALILTVTLKFHRRQMETFLPESQMKLGKDLKNNLSKNKALQLSDMTLPY